MLDCFCIVIRAAVKKYSVLLLPSFVGGGHRSTVTTCLAAAIRRLPGARAEDLVAAASSREMSAAASYVGAGLFPIVARY